MFKRASSSSDGRPVAKKAKPDKSVVTKKIIASSSVKKNVKDSPKSSNKQDDTNNASTSKYCKRLLRSASAAQLEAERKKAEAYDEELDQHVVERILDKYIQKDGVTKYKVKWLNYEKCTWEEVNNLANAMKHVLKWEREEGQNWQLENYPLKYDDPMYKYLIREEYLRLTAGDYRIKEKYGIANGHAWYLMERDDDGDEKVLCLKDGDPYYEQMNAEDNAHVKQKRAWDDFTNETAAEKSPRKTSKTTKSKK